MSSINWFILKMNTSKERRLSFLNAKEIIKETLQEDVMSDNSDLDYDDEEVSDDELEGDEGDDDPDADVTDEGSESASEDSN